MSKRLRWRGFIILIVIVVALVYLTPSITKSLPAWWSNILPEEKIHLGLDLKGVMHLALEVQAQKAVESHLERTVEDIKYSLRKAKIRYQELKRSSSDRIGLTLIRGEDRKAAEEMVANNFPDLAVESGQIGPGATLPRPTPPGVVQAGQTIAPIVAVGPPVADCYRSWLAGGPGPSTAPADADPPRTETFAVPWFAGDVRQALNLMKHTPRLTTRFGMAGGCVVLRHAVVLSRTSAQMYS